MLTNKRLTFIILCALPLIIVAGLAHAQKKPRATLPIPITLSGADIGFRVQGDRGDHVVGTLVVRMNGEWIAAEPVGGVKTLSSLQNDVYLEGRR